MKKISIIFTLFCLLSVVACKKTLTEQTQPEIKGSVALADEGGKFFSDNSRMTVSIENSTSLISTVTDSKGNFVLPLDPSLKSFTIVYSKPEFGTFKRYFTTDNAGKLYYWNGNEQFQTDQITEQLSKKSSVIVNSFNVVIVGDTLKISCNISSADAGQKYIRLLTGKDLPNISIDNVDKTNINNWGVKLAIRNGDNIINSCLKCAETCHGWMSGDVIYFTAYGDSYFGNWYFDRSTNEDVFPDLNINNGITPVSVVIP